MSEAATPAAARHMIRDAPPAATTGIGTPMTGKTPTTTPMLISACPTSHTVMHSRLTRNGPRAAGPR